MNNTLARRIQIRSERPNTPDDPEEAVYPEGQFDLPYDKMQARDSNGEAFLVEG